VGVLATYMANCRTRLAASPASLAALPEGVSIDDVPEADKTFFAVTALEDATLGAEHGGGTLVEYEGTVVVKVAWLIDLDEEAFEDTIQNDRENINAVMLKTSNWTSGIIIVNPGPTTRTREGNFHRADLFFPVRYRVAQTLT